MSVIVDGSNGLIFNDASTQTTAATGFGFKNRLINGDMRIDQRNAGASVTPGAAFGYQLDRWTYGTSVASKISVQQVNDAPANFYNSVKLTSLSAYTVTANDRFIFSQCIEGHNTYDIAWGTANAQAVTLSFWVKSSLTGTFACSFNNTAGSYTYVTTYTISSANTWERKTITIPGVTSGAWNNGTNSGSIWVVFDLGTGSTYTTSTLNAWQNAFYENATGAVALPAVNGATWQITGVQLEKGSTATAFDYRDYGRELQLCQRYYEVTYAPGVAVGTGLAQCWASSVTTVNASAQGNGWPFKVTKRATPTIVFYNAVTAAVGYSYRVSDAASVATTDSYTGPNGIGYINVPGNANGYYYHFTASAEL